jgi:hypothetical protein
MPERGKMDGAAIGGDATLSGTIDNLNIHPSINFIKLIAGAEPITFLTFDDRKNPEGGKDRSLTKELHGHLIDHLPVLLDLNARGAGIFFTVNQTDLKGRKQENIKEVRAVFVDLDGSPLEPVKNAPLPPHVIIESSPGRFHAYWKIVNLDLSLFKVVQKALASCFNGDGAVCDLSRTMRLPGFFHQKGGAFLTNVIQSNEIPQYEAAAFLKAFKIDLKKDNGSTDSQSKGAHFSNGEDPILDKLKEYGLFRGPILAKVGAWNILCPWRGSHTTGDEGVAYFSSGTGGYSGAGFKCQHSHCADRTIVDLKAYLGVEEHWEEPISLNLALPPVDPLTPDMLPDPIRAWLEDNATRMSVPLEFMAIPALVIIGSLVGRKIGIYPKAYDSWIVVGNLWGMLIGRPSLLKSPAINAARKPLDKLVTQAREGYERDIKQYEQDKEWAEAQKGERKDQLKKAARSKKKPVFENLETTTAVAPNEKRFFTCDATVEKIGEILLHNPEGILILRDELAGWLRSLEKPGREGDRQFFLESFNGVGKFIVDRIQRGTLSIPALCLSIIGTIQPGPLGSYLKDALSGGSGDDGMVPRFQLAVYPDVPSKWENVDRFPDKEAEGIATQVFENIANLSPPAVENEIPGVRFSEDAQQIFNKWREHLEHRLLSRELSLAMEAQLGKYRSLAPKLALIFYLINTVGVNGVLPVLCEVGPSEIELAIRWCAYLEKHACRIYNPIDPAVESANALLEKLRQGILKNGFSIREIYHGRHWAHLENSEKALAAVKILQDGGWVRFRPGIGTGGRTTNQVEIHPCLRRAI